jgi:hypothetical protein
VRSREKVSPRRFPSLLELRYKLTGIPFCLCWLVSRLSLHSAGKRVIEAIFLYLDRDVRRPILEEILGELEEIGASKEGYWGSSNPHGFSLRSKRDGRPVLTVIALLLCSVVVKCVLERRVLEEVDAVMSRMTDRLLPSAFVCFLSKDRTSALIATPISLDTCSGSRTIPKRTPPRGLLQCFGPGEEPADPGDHLQIR